MYIYIIIQYLYSIILYCYFHIYRFNNIINSYRNMNNKEIKIELDKD